MGKKIFIFSLLFACSMQFFIFKQLDMVDFGMWAKQAADVEAGHSDQFDYLRAYGHPGGPLIEGTIAIHRAFGLSYEASLMLFILALDGAATALSCLIAYKLGGNHLWWPAALAALSSNWLYVFSSPPSITASLIIVLLFLYSLYIWKENDFKPVHIALWGILAGAAAATRFDIGVIASLAALAFVKSRMSWRRAFWAVAGGALAFIAFDPFMWYMPFQHLKDLVFKIVFHYGTLTNQIPIWRILSVSAFLLAGAMVATMLLTTRSKSLLPPRFLYILLGLTAALYAIFLTAHYQALRYFLPIISVWEAILPALIFGLTARAESHYSKKADIPISVLLTASPIVSVLLLM